MLFLILLPTFLIIILLVENRVHSRRLERIPLRITVSGTRGKTTIVRTLASVLRTAGMTVLAKTTGSEAMYVLPDGTEKPVKRHGMPTILEQKKHIKLACSLNADCIITEIMSINNENHYIETHRLLKPGITVLSNFRADHTTIRGESPAELSKPFLNDIYPGSKIFINEKDLAPGIQEIIKIRKAELFAVNSDKYEVYDTDISKYQFPENLNLIRSVALNLNLSEDSVLTGIGKATRDIGSFSLFNISMFGKEIIFVNSFAANDPLSTTLLAKRVLKISGKSESDLFGLIILRGDREERSRQWLDFLSSPENLRFNKLFAAGYHARVFNRRLDYCEYVRSTDPDKITRQIIESIPDGSVVLGLANIVGLGSRLNKHWKSVGIELESDRK